MPLMSGAIDAGLAPASRPLSAKEEKALRKKRVRDRVWEVDFLRGFIILAVLGDHLAGDFSWLFPTFFVTEEYNAVPWLLKSQMDATFYWNHPARHAIRLLAIMLLFLIAGISCRFSRSNLKRGAAILAVGIFLSIFFRIWTLLDVGGEGAFFTTISAIGLAILLYWAFKSVYARAVFLFHRLVYRRRQAAGKLDPRRVAEPVHLADPRGWKWWSLAFAFLFLALSFVIAVKSPLLDPTAFYPPAYVSILDQFPPMRRWLIFARDPDFVVHYPSLAGLNWLRTIVGVGREAAFSDWLPIFPGLFFIFLGGFLGETLYARKLSATSLFIMDGEGTSEQRAEARKVNAALNRITAPINLMGRNTLVFYFAHQVVYVILFVPIVLAFGVHLSL